MRRASAVSFGLLLASVACSQAQPPDAFSNTPPPLTRTAASVPVAHDASGGLDVPLAPPKPDLSPAAFEAEVVALRAELAQEVPHLVPQTPASEQRWIALAQEMIARSGHRFDRPQLIVVVDRSPHVQQLCLLAIRPDGPWRVIGGTHVSTGQAGRKDHYITPTGVFLHTNSILDYRAEGTFNENHIRGLGLKGMRVWDFGWQSARKGWLKSGERGDIRLLVHSTDPAYLEQRIGRAASSGCVRVPSAMNRFMDRHGVLDADYEQTATYDVAFRAILPRDRVPTPLAGDALVVVDSSGQG
jgi:hypothetical protein